LQRFLLGSEQEVEVHFEDHLGLPATCCRALQ
jgi:hypothetical protein